MARKDTALDLVNETETKTDEGTKAETKKEIKTFEDKTFSAWIIDDDENIKVGESLKKILKGDCETLFVKDMIFGKPSNTWRIVTTTDDKIILLKSAREMK